MRRPILPTMRPRKPGRLAPAVVLVMLLAAASLLAAAEPREQAATGLARAVLAVGLTVSDMDRSLRFFTEVLPFEKGTDVEVAGPEYERLQGVFGLRMRVVGLRLGDEHLELIQYLAPRGRPIPVDSRSNDGWFQHVAIVVRDMDQAYRVLRAHGVEYASSGPQRLPDWNKSAGGIRAFYFKDPDGHPLEIIWFPAGKGDPRWQRPTDRLFLGIDHTAIVVRDTDASLGFYRDLLGLTVAGESENYGEEQERLNNVFGARLHITGLRAPAGPGVEFLQYLAPTDGRPYPADSRANDLWHWQTEIATANAETAAREVRHGRYRWISPGAVELPGRDLGFEKGTLARDPDGHAVLLEER